MAVGLAMDCCAVSVVQGLNSGRWDRRALLMAAIFGLFHFGMPIIGFYAGGLFVNFMSRYAPWIALGLLGFLGAKMIWESYHEHAEEEKKANWHVTNLLLLALATSATFSIGGFLIGVFVGELKINMELIGGLVLIGLGVKICLEGVCF